LLPELFFAPEFVATFFPDVEDFPVLRAVLLPTLPRDEVVDFEAVALLVVRLALEARVPFCASFIFT
jgi:hypothetical protein